MARTVWTINRGQSGTATFAIRSSKRSSKREFNGMVIKTIPPRMDPFPLPRQGDAFILEISIFRGCQSIISTDNYTIQALLLS